MEDKVDDLVAQNCRSLINHGSQSRYYHDVLGYNCRMTNIAAAIGVEQLKKLKSYIRRRRENATLLSTNLFGVQGIVLPNIIDGHVFHQYTIRILSSAKILREEFQEKLREAGIGSSIYYPLPIHKQEAYKEHNMLLLPVTEKLAQEVLSIPIHPGVSLEQIGYISKTIRSLMHQEQYNVDRQEDTL